MIYDTASSFAYYHKPDSWWNLEFRGFKVHVGVASDNVIYGLGHVELASTQPCPVEFTEFYCSPYTRNYGYFHSTGDNRVACMHVTCQYAGKQHTLYNKVYVYMRDMNPTTTIEGSQIVQAVTLPGKDGSIWVLRNSIALNWAEFVSNFKGFQDPLEAMSQFLATIRPVLVQDGIKKLEMKYADMIRRLEAEEPTLYGFYVFLHGKNTVGKASNNQLLGAFLTHIDGDYDTFRSTLYNAITISLVKKGKIYREDAPGRFLLEDFPGAAEKLDSQEAKSRWQYANSARQKAEVLGILPDKHPNLLRLLEGNEITFNTFHEPGKEDTLVNVEFDRFEWALSQPDWEPALKQILATVSGRTTYTHSISSYIAFLRKLPKYLDRHAPRPDGSKWKAMPSYVDSAWKLEMDEATEEGTTKRRSALTPVADNDTGIVTIPYASIRMSGVQTTYCYSENYYVVEEDMVDPLGNGVFPSDLEEKLNGRDDYGLMFYTLTGTPRNQGYPTFLIIFERTENAHGGTRVHFHRVHPSRYRGPNGSDTPSNRLIQECYRYMAGNVMASEISYQQGDIMLIRTEAIGKTVDEGAVVTGFENHSFVGKNDTPVMLYRSTAKKPANLGWIKTEGMDMPHPEHESILNIPAGIYEVRRAKSWEANPSSVWVLRID